MTILIKKDSIEVRKSILHGWGVFAKRDIPKNTIIEDCHGLFLSKSEFLETRHIPAIACNTFVVGDSIMIPYGYGAIYNSKRDNSVSFKFDKNKNIISFYTVIDIKENEELFLNYESARLMYKEKNIEL